MIVLKEIDINNFWDIISLKVSENQEELVTSNAVSIAQAKVQVECQPRAIYQDELPVGFIMYCIDRDDNEWWIYRLMIDEKFQSRGIGRAAMELVISKIQMDKTREKIYVGVDSRGILSKRLYEALGFKYTGDKFGKEEIMVLNY